MVRIVVFLLSVLCSMLSFVQAEVATQAILVARPPSLWLNADYNVRNEALQSAGENANVRIWQDFHNQDKSASARTWGRNIYPSYGKSDDKLFNFHRTILFDNKRVTSYPESLGYSSPIYSGNINNTGEGLNIFMVLAPEYVLDPDPKSGDRRYSYVFSEGSYIRTSFGLRYGAKWYIDVQPNRDGSKVLNERGEATSILHYQANFKNKKVSLDSDLENHLFSRALTVSAFSSRNVGYNKYLRPFSIAAQSMSQSMNHENGRYFNGRIAEVIIYKGILTDEETLTVHSYLAAKYGITFANKLNGASTSNYIYKTNSEQQVLWDVNRFTDSNYNHNIAGLVRYPGNVLHQKISKSINDDAVLTISTNNNFIDDALSDRPSVGDVGSAIFWGHNQADNHANVRGPTGVYLVNRTWRAQVSKNAGHHLSIAVDLDNPAFDLPTSPLNNYYMVIDKDHDGSFENDQKISLTKNEKTGHYQVDNISIADGDRFSFGAGVLVVELDATQKQGSEATKSAPFGFWVSGGTSSQPIPLNYIVELGSEVGEVTANDIALEQSAIASFSIDSGDFTKPVLINDTGKIFIEDDDLIEGDERFFSMKLEPVGDSPGFYIGDANQDGVITESLADYTIKDNDHGEIIISDLDVVEGEGLKKIKLELKGKTVTQLKAAGTIEVKTAQQGIDYKAIIPQILTFNKAEDGSQVAYFEFDVLEDNIVEANESFGLEIVGIDQQYLNLIDFTDKANINIISNNKVGFNVSSTLTETDTNHIETIEIRSDTDIEKPLSISFNLTGNQADYLLENPVTIDFSNTKAGTVKTIPITIVGDDIFEGDELVGYSLLGVTANADDVIRSSGNLKITDDDQLELKLSIDDVEVVEGAKAVIKLVSNIETAFDYRVNLVLKDSLGQAFGQGTYAVNFAAGSKKAQVEIDILDDEIAEKSEVIDLSIADFVATGFSEARADITDTAKLTVKDNDTVVVSISDVVVTEGIDDIGTVKLNINRVLSEDLEIEVGVAASSTGIIGEDVLPLEGAPTSFTFKANQEKSQSVDVSFKIVKDDIVEGSEVFISNVSEPLPASGLLVDVTDTGNVTILDASQAVVEVISQTVDETKGTVSIEVKSNHQIIGGFSVKADLIATDKENKAQADQDYIVNSESLLLDFDGVLNESKSIEIEIVNDQLIENNEIFEVTLSDLKLKNLESTTAEQITLKSGEVIIDSEDIGVIAPILTFVREDQELAKLAVRFIGETEKQFSADYATVNGPRRIATVDEDYVGLSGSLLFEGKNTEEQFVSVKIIDDEEKEFNEIIAVSFSNMSLEDVRFEPSDSYIDIIDDDSAIILKDATIREGAQDLGNTLEKLRIEAEILEKVPAGSSFDLEIIEFENSLVVNQASSDDYNAPSSMTMTFPTGSIGETAVIEIEVKDDDLVEQSEFFGTKAVANTNTPVGLELPKSSYNRIVDNDSAGVSIVDIAVDESIGIAKVLVLLNQEVSEGFTVGYSTIDDTAVAGEDYTATSGVVAFKGELNETQTINIVINDDDIVEGDQDLWLTLGFSSSPRVAITDSLSRIRIHDNDQATVFIRPVNVDENVLDQLARVAVTLDKAIQNNTLKVFVKTVVGENDTATLNQDYLERETTLFFKGEKGETQIFDVAIIDDKDDPVVEKTESFTVALTGSNLSEIKADSSATVSIIDNDHVNAFVVADVLANEELLTVLVRVKQQGRVDFENTVDLRLKGISATMGADFDGTTKKVTFKANVLDDTQLVKIPIYQDDIVEGDETIQLILENPSTDALKIDSTERFITIVDQDTSVVNILDASVREGDDGRTSLNVVFQLTDPVAAGFDLDVVVESDTAILGADFIKPTQPSLAFSGLANEKQTLSIDVIGDNIVEEDETILISMGTLNRVNTNESKKVSILNDDQASIKILDVLAKEEDEIAVVNLSLSNPVQDGVSVQVVTKAETAKAATENTANDYVDATQVNTVIFNDQLTGSTKITLFDDELVEGSETFNLSLSHVSRPNVDISSTATAIISDQDQAAVSIKVIDTVESENKGGFYLTLSKAVSKDSKFLVSTNQAGTATTGNDFVALTQREVIIKANTKQSAFIPLEVKADKLVEPRETIQFSVVKSLDNTLNDFLEISSDIASAELVIKDDSTASITASIEPVSEKENGSEVLLTLRVKGEVDDKFSIKIASEDQTAKGGKASGQDIDYQIMDQTVEFLAGETEKQIKLTIYDDQIVEPDESFTLSFNSETALGIRMPDDLSVLISDNDQAVFEVITKAPSVTEGENVSVSVKLKTAVSAPIKLTLVSEDQTAVAGKDYDQFETEMEFSGQIDEVKSWTIQTTEDDTIENKETFLIKENSDEVGLLPRVVPDTVISIDDNDQGTVKVIANRGSEEDGFVNIDLWLDKAVDQSFTVNVSTVIRDGLDSIEVSDFEAITNQSVTFLGQANQEIESGGFLEVQSIKLFIENDGLVEDDETVFVSLSDIGHPSIRGENAVMTIQSEDQAHLLVDSQTVSEDGLTAELSVRLSRFVEDGVDISFETTVREEDDSAATEGVDYQKVVGDISFSGDISEVKTISIPISDDDETEANERFYVTFSDATKSDVIPALLDDTQPFVIINDNDADILLDSVIVDEGDEFAMITVTLNRSFSEGFNLDLLLVEETAALQKDYLPFIFFNEEAVIRKTLTFDSGILGQTLTEKIELVDDKLFEITEHFRVELISKDSNLEGVQLPIGSSVYIRDNDLAGLSVSSATVNEEDGSVDIDISLNGAVQNETTVSIKTIDATAVSGEDYRSATKTVTFLEGEEGTQSITLTDIINDNIVEDEQYFYVEISVDNSNVEINQPRAKVHIISEDKATIKIVQETIALLEGQEKEDAMTVYLENPVQSETPVDIFVTSFIAEDDTAEADDFLALKEAIHFTGKGDESIHVGFKANSDELVEGDERLTIHLSSNIDHILNIVDLEKPVTILDDDLQAELSISIDNVVEGELATIRVSLDKAVEGGFSIDLKPILDSAEADDISNTGDITAALNAKKLVFNFDESDESLQKKRSITLQTKDDDIVELAEQIRFGFENSTSELVTFSTETLVILDNDGLAKIVLESQSFSESGGVASVLVSIDKLVENGVQVDVVAKDKTAVTEDYTLTTKQISFSGQADNKVATILVNIKNDDLLEGDETFNLSFTNASHTGVDTTVSRDMIILDDDDDQKASLTFIGNATLVESSGEVSIKVQLDKPIQGGLTANVSSLAATATDQLDYQLVSQTISFLGQANETQEIKVKINDDRIFEGDETFGLVLSDLSSSFVELPLQHNITITDDDSATVRVLKITNSESEDQDQRFIEEDQQAEVQLILEGEVQRGAEVFLSTSSENTSASENDYTGLSQYKVSFEGKDQEIQTAKIVLNDDTVVENDEAISILLTSEQVSTENGQIIIDSGDQAFLMTKSVQVDESEENLVLDVSLSNDIEGGITIDYQTIDGDEVDRVAVSGKDYQKTAGKLQLTGKADEVQSITIPMIDDFDVEMNEKLYVLFAGGGYQDVKTRQATPLLITDDDSSFIIADTQTIENQGKAKLTIQLNHQAFNGKHDLSFNVVLVDHSAESGKDYTNQVIPVVFAKAFNGQSQDIMIDILDDQLVEEKERFFATITDISYAGEETLQLPRPNANQIIDNDLAGITILGGQVREKSDSEEKNKFLVDVALTKDIRPFSIYAKISDQSAIRHEDYSISNPLQKIEFKEGEGSLKQIEITIEDDLIVEDIQTIGIDLIKPSSPDVSLINTHADVEIISDDVAVVEIAEDRIDLVEGGSKNLNVLLQSVIQTKAPIQVLVSSFIAATDSAESSDFKPVLESIEFIGNGEAETKSVSLMAIDDAVIEGDETFSVSLQTNLDSLLLTEDQSTIHIQDQQEDVALLSIDSVSIFEGNEAVIQAQLNRAVEGGFQVSLTPKLQTAEIDDVITTLQKTVLSFKGEKNEVQRLTLKTNDDLVVETDETITFEVDLQSSLVSLASTDPVVLTIKNNDGKANLSINSQTITEGDDALFTVFVDKVVEGGFTVELVPEFVTANSDDFNGVVSKKTLNFSFTESDLAAQKQRKITIQTRNDQIVEPTETVAFQFEALSSPLVAIAEGGPKILTIFDNSERVSLSVESAVVVEGNTAEIKVVSNQLVKGGFSVNLVPQFITAEKEDILNGGDIGQTLATKTIEFSENSKESQMIQINIKDDDLIESDETIRFVLVDATSDLVTLTGKEEGILTITESKKATLKALSQSVAESAGKASVKLLLDYQVDGGVDVIVSTVNRENDLATSDADKDFDLIDKQKISIDGLEGLVDINLYHDGIVEDDETVLVQIDQVLINNQETDLIQTEDGVLTIESDDRAYLVVLDQTVDEDSETAELLVGLSRPVEGGVSLSYKTADGDLEIDADNATVALDYVKKTGVLDFTGSFDEQQRVVLSIADDDLSERNEMFNVLFSDSTKKDVYPTRFDGSSPFVVINDNDYDIIFKTVIVNEIDQKATIVAELNGDFVGERIEVGVSLLPATATQEDFKPIEASFVFENAVNGRTASQTISIIDDQIIEEMEWFVVSVTSQSSSIDRTYQITEQAAVYIIDQEQKGLSIASLDILEAENQGNDVLARAAITLSELGKGATSVTIVPQSASAVLDEDYLAEQKVIQFEGVSNDASGKEIQYYDFIVKNDDLVEVDQSFNLVITHSTNPNIEIVRSHATANIISEDKADIVFKNNQMQVNEGDKQPVVFSLSKPVQTPEPIEILIATEIDAGNTAEDSDFNAMRQTVAYESQSVAEKTVEVETVSDDYYENRETLTVRALSTSQPEMISMTNSALITIVDSADKQPSVSISSPSVIEGGDAVVTISLDQALEEAASVRLLLALGDTETEDIQLSSTSHLIEFSAGETKKEFVLKTINDDLVEPDEVITLTLESVPASLILVTGDEKGEVTIKDNEVDANLSISTTSVNEGEMIEVSVSVDQSVEGGFSVVVTPDFETADSNDVEAISAKTLVFNETDRSKVIQIKAVADDILEPSETIRFHLSEISHARVNAENSSVVTTIFDLGNQAIVVVEPAELVEGDEGEQLASIVIRLNKSINDSVTVNIATENLTAGASDYQLKTTSLSLSNITEMVQLAIIGDEIVEGNEQFRIHFSSDSPLVADSSAIITIKENDLIDMSLVKEDIRVYEDDNFAEVKFILNSKVETDMQIAVDYTHNNNELEATDSDYSKESRLDIEKNSEVGEVVSVKVPILNDTDIENTEYFNVSVADQVARVGIIDNDGSPVIEIIRDINNPEASCELDYFNRESSSDSLQLLDDQELLDHAVFFRLFNCAIGEEVRVMLHYDNIPAHAGLYKLSENGLLTMIDSDVERNVNVISYVITDGGELDQDGVDNGIIIDPVGLIIIQSGQDQSLQKIPGNNRVGLLLMVLLILTLGCFYQKKIKYMMR